MKRQRLVRCIGMGLAGCLLMAGCADKKVDYDIEGTKTAETELSQGGKTGVKQFADDVAWTDEWIVTTSKGNTVKILVDADIIVPTVEQMSVVEVEETVFDEEYKRHIVKQIFGNEEIYYNDISHLTKKELSEMRAEYEALYEEYEAGGLESEQRMCRDKIREFDAALKKAKDTHTLAEDFSADAYWGSHEGIAYNLSFVEEDSINYGCSRSISLVPRDAYEVCPKKFQDVENLTFEVWNPQSHGKLTENLCELSEEEAKKEAQSFVENLELEYPVYDYSESLVWGDAGKKSEWTTAGYVFHFGFGKDNLSFADFGTEKNYWNFTKKRDKTGYSMEARATVYVTDIGVIMATVQNPVGTIGTSEEIGLLPLEEIQGIIEEHVTNHLGDFRFFFSMSGEVDLNEMELIYFRLKNRKKQRCYSYIPVWRLACVQRDGNVRVDGIYNQVLINAIDGSVIDFYDEA